MDEAGTWAGWRRSTQSARLAVCGGPLHEIAFTNQPQDPMLAGQEQRGSVAIGNWELARPLAHQRWFAIYGGDRPRKELGGSRCQITFGTTKNRKGKLRWARITGGGFDAVNNGRL